MSFSRMHSSKYIYRQSINVIYLSRHNWLMWKDRLALWFTNFRKLVLPSGNVADTALQQDQAWRKRRCSLSSKFEQALALLHAVSNFFELKIISDIYPFQWYRCIIAMSVSSATTITGLSFLEERWLIAAEITVRSASSSHWITNWSPLSKYLKISVIIHVLLFSLERYVSWAEWNILLSLITTSWHLIGDLLVWAFVFVDKRLL